MSKKLVCSVLASLGIVSLSLYAEEQGRGGEREKARVGGEVRGGRGQQDSHQAPVRQGPAAAPAQQEHGRLPGTKPAELPRRPVHQGPVVVKGLNVVNRPYVYRGKPMQRQFVENTWGHNRYLRFRPSYRAFSPTVYAHFDGPRHWRWHPFHYGWVWIYPAWWGGYGYYYRPYREYSDPADWLTDYVFITTMYGPTYESHPYEAYGTGYNQGYQDAMVSDSEKAQVRTQVEEELHRNGTEGSAPESIIEKLRDPNDIELVSRAITATRQDGSGGSCALTDGDLLKPIAPPQSSDVAVRMKVITAKKESCQAGSDVLISLTDLQSFQNDFSESIETGLQRLEEEKEQLNQN